MSSVIITLFLIHVANSWNLDHLIPDDAVITSVSIWHSKAFLGVPRERRDVKATLISAPWPPETDKMRAIFNLPVAYSVRAYPTAAAQVEGDCRALQSVAATQEEVRGRLWVLDVGTEACRPKIVVYDLWRNDEVMRSELPTAHTAALRAMAVDVGTRTRVYVGDVARGVLLVFSVAERRWWRLQLTSTSPIPGRRLQVSTSTLALSRRDQLLYVTSNTTDLLYVVDLKTISEPHILDDHVKTVNVTCLGSKLGPSSGLAVDLNAGLHYFLVRDHAAVRWDTRRPLRAESHAVLLQSAALLPAVAAVFLDQQGQVWAVTAHHVVKLQDYSNVPRQPLF